MDELRLLLQRGKSTNVSTPGTLHIDGKFECFTLEDVVRPTGVKVYGQTAIPAGIYEVQLTYSPKFSPKYGGLAIPLLVAVANFLGVRIHWGNKAADTDGCILVGDAPGVDWVGQSRVAFDRLYAKLQAAVGAGKKITIEIREAV
jgi:hypothetical protein